MTKGTERCRRNRKFKPGNGTWFSDEMLYAFSRGLSTPPRREEHGPPCGPDDAEAVPTRRAGWLTALVSRWRR